MSQQNDHKTPAKSPRPAPSQPDSAQKIGTDPRVARLMSLQKLVGNQAAQRLIRRQTDKNPATIPHVPSFRASTPDISREDENVAMGRQLFDEGHRLYQEGQYAAAAVRLERARQVPGLSDEVYTYLLYDLGMCNLRLERFATAVMYFEQYLGRPDADTETGETMLEQARQGTAGDAANIMNREGAGMPPPSTDPAQQATNAQTLFQQAVALYESGDYRQSIILLEQIREMEITENAEAIRASCLFNIARCNMRLERYATAIIYLEQYIDVAPSDADRREAETLLVQAQEHAGTLTSAEQGHMMYRMAREAYDAGDYATALQRFNTILTVRGIDEDIRLQIEYNIAMCYIRSGRPAEAIPHLERYLAAHPDDAEARARLEEARQASNEALEEESIAE